MDRPTFEKIIRAVKIKYIINGKELKVDEKSYQKFKKSKEYKIYRKHYDGKVITGSHALNLLGLLNRDPKDLDVLDDSDRIFNYTRNDDYFFEMDGSYRGSVTHHYGFLGRKEMFVDVFKENEYDKIVYKDIVLDNVISILECKYDMEGSVGKHHTDIEQIYNLL